MVINKHFSVFIWGASNYSIVWKGSKLSFPVSTVLIKASKQKVWQNERTLAIESRNVLLWLCEKLLPFIIQHYLLLGWPRIRSQVVFLAHFFENQIPALKINFPNSIWGVVKVISKDQLQNRGVNKGGAIAPRFCQNRRRRRAGQWRRAALLLAPPPPF